MFMSLWASKFATAEIECSFEMGGQVNTFRGTIYFAADCTISNYYNITDKVYFFILKQFVSLYQQAYFIDTRIFLKKLSSTIHYLTIICDCRVENTIF